MSPSQYNNFSYKFTSLRIVLVLISGSVDFWLDCILFQSVPADLTAFHDVAASHDNSYSRLAKGRMVLLPLPRVPVDPQNPQKGAGQQELVGGGSSSKSILPLHKM